MTRSWPPAAADVDRLLETLAIVETRSPHYRARFPDAGVKVADLRGYDDFRRRVPRTAKVELVATQGESLPSGPSSPDSLLSSPGHRTD